MAISLPQHPIDIAMLNEVQFLEDHGTSSNGACRGAALKEEVINNVSNGGYPEGEVRRTFYQLAKNGDLNVETYQGHTTITDSGRRKKASYKPVIH